MAEWLRRCTANPMDSVRVGFAQKGFRFDYMMLAKVGLLDLKTTFVYINICMYFSKKKWLDD